MSRRNFGNQVVGTQSVQFPPANYKAVCRFQNTSGSDLRIIKFHGHWSVINESVRIKAVIYSDNGGAPGELLAVSNERIGIPTGHWASLSFATPFLIPRDTYVWFGVIADTMLSDLQCSSVGVIHYNANNYSDGPSQSFGTATTAPYTYRMFLEGEDDTASFGRRSIDITGIASNDGNYQPDREHADRVFLDSPGSVNVTSISTYIRNTVPTVKSKAAIYSDNAGYPGTKLAQTEEVMGSTAGTWLTLSIPGGVILSPGTYWLAFVSSENLTTAVIPYSGALIVDGPMTEANAFYSTYPTGSPVVVTNPDTDGRGIDIYASYEDPPVLTGRAQVFVAT